MMLEEIAFLIVMTAIVTGALLQDRKECNNEKISVKKAIVTSAMVFIVMTILLIGLQGVTKIFIEIAKETR